jgi:hypothetical protein
MVARAWAVVLVAMLCAAGQPVAVVAGEVPTAPEEQVRSGASPVELPGWRRTTHGYRRDVTPGCESGPQWVRTPQGFHRVPACQWVRGEDVDGVRIAAAAGIAPPPGLGARRASFPALEPAP